MQPTSTLYRRVAYVGKVKFCRVKSSRDSIEHIAKCEVVRKCFNAPSHAKHLFLLVHDDSELLRCARLVFGLYSYHCHACHDDSPGTCMHDDIVDAVKRLAADTGVAHT